MRPGRSARSTVASAAGRLILACAMSAPAVASVRAQSAGEALPESPKWALTGTLLHLMRGMFFPNANLIFNVQSRNPALKKPAPNISSGGPGFDWVKWGASLYPGWDDLEYAAVSLAEITPLLLTPGRLCQNGKPVPVERPDWVVYTKGMLDAARKTTEAARAKNRQAAIASTSDLSDACQACHRVYRDRRGPGPATIDPAQMTLRCTAP
jgi:hypothetical protein